MARLLFIPDAHHVLRRPYTARASADTLADSAREETATRCVCMPMQIIRVMVPLVLQTPDRA